MSGNSDNTSGPPRIPGLDMLGYGYNLFKSSYCDPESATSPLLTGLDCAGAPTVRLPNYPGSYLCPTFVRCITENSSSDDYTIGAKTVEEYTSSLAVKSGVSGSYGAFSGSIDASYSQSKASYLENVYGEHGHVFSGITLQLPKRASLLRAILKPDVKADLLAMTPEEVIKTYGTHLVSEVVIGAKSLMRQYSTRSDVKDTQAWKVAVEASYASVSTGTTVEGTSSSHISKFQMGQEIHTRGGDNRLVKNRADFAEWLKQAYTTPTIVEMHAAVPIWQLLDPHTEGAKREELKRGIVTYAKAFEIGVLYGATQIHNNRKSEGVWVGGSGGSGRKTYYLGALSWCDLHGKGYSQSFLFQGTGQEARELDAPQALAIYGGRQQKSKDDSSAPWREFWRWGSDTHPETKKPLDEMIASMVFTGQGPADYDFGMTKLSFFVGPVEEAPASAWVVVGGHQVYKNGSSPAWGQGATERIREQQIGFAHGYNGNDFAESTVYLHLRAVGQTLPEMAE